MWNLYNFLKNYFKKGPVEVYSLELLERDCLKIEDSAKNFRKDFGHNSQFKVVTEEYIAKKHQEISVLKNKINELDHIKQDLFTKQNHLTLNLKQLTDEATSTKVKLRNLEANSDAQKKNYHLLLQQIAEVEKNVEDSEQQEENYTSLNKNFSHALSKRQQEYIQLKTDKATCEENISNLSSKKDEMLLQMELLKNQSNFIADQLKVMSVQIQNLDTENAAIIKEYKKYEYLLEIKKNEFSKIADQKKILEVTKANALEGVVKVQGEIDSLNERIAFDVNVIEETVARNNELNFEFKEKSQTIIRLMDEAEKLPQEIRIYQLETEELNKKLTPVRAELNDLVIKHGAIRSEFGEIHQSYQKAESDYDKFSKTIDDLKTKINQFETDKESTKQAHAECSTRLLGIQNEVTVLTQELTILNVEFGKSDQNLFESLQQFENLTQEKEKLIADKNELNVKAIDLTNALATHNHNIREIRSFVEAAADENQDLGNDVREAQDLLVEIKNALGSEQNSFNQLQKNKSDLLENLRNFHQEIASITAMLAENDVLVQTLTEENIAIKNVYEERSQMINVRKELSLQLISEVSILAKENDKYRSDIVLMEQEHRKINLEVNKLAATKEELRRENILLTDKASELTEILTEQNHASLGLQKQISNLQAQINTLKTLIMKSEKDLIGNNDQNATRDIYVKQLNKIKRNLENQ